MNRLLYIQASPRGDQSHSIAAADLFLAAYRSAHPDDEIVTLNLFEKELPPFNGDTLQSKYAILYGQDKTDSQQTAWRDVEDIISEFTSADKYVMAVPMWNFSIPYRLKHYIDLLVQPTYTFSYSPEEGFSGLVVGKPVFVSYARGNVYPPGSQSEALDLQTRYLEQILGFIGFSDIRRLIVEPTLTGPGPVTLGREVIEKAEEMARSF